MRWRTVTDEEDQGTLFDAPSREVGRGEFRGMTFLHVRAQRVINSLPPGGRLPFRHTINAYRGCSHACSYCLGAETAVLLADGTTRPIADIRPGDHVVGTQRRGVHRRYVSTEVLDHWQTHKPAFRVTLDDGTVLVASGDHRFLTDRGWKHVTGAERGAGRRPHLTPSNRLVGPGRDLRELGVETSERCPAEATATRRPVDAIRATGRARDDVVNLRVRGGLPELGADRRVVSVEPIGEQPLYDLTTGTGDFVAEGVISHNCFARPTHDHLGLDVDEGFDREIVVKVNAVERVRAELAPRRWAGEPIAMGTNTDPYQRCEGKFRLTQGIVEVLTAARNPFSILTKSTLLLRDAELLAEAARRTDVTLTFSVGTLDPGVWRATEPGTPAPWQRLEAIARLRAAGVRCGVLVAPVLPGLSDGEQQLRAVVEAARDAGASSIAGGQLAYLTPMVRTVFLRRLGRSHPELVARYEASYRGSRPPRSEQERVRRILDDAIGRRSAVAVGRPRRPAAGAGAAPAPGVQQLTLGV